MAVARFLLLLGVLVFLCLSEVYCEGQLEEGFEGVRGPNRRLMRFIDCGGSCKRRCGAHSRPKLCIRACGTCCARCRCVPPGTSGNREVCGRCYTGMTTHHNKTKCP
ncbi:snakin-2-like [Momordica charantia]|uniref:Snakin-2-like n=1 Tax=Momordica charantia TaxID=3673 RepID=A0A6J1CAF9_MOMCH|nr:snakin-2-like [Momordica charantia]